MVWHTLKIIGLVIMLVAVLSGLVTRRSKHPVKLGQVLVGLTVGLVIFAVAQ